MQIIKDIRVLEAHMLGFFLGFVFSNWALATGVWLVFLTGLYLRHVWRLSDEVEEWAALDEGCLEGEEDTPKVRIATMPDSVRVEMRTFSDAVPFLIQEGFDLNESITWYDDPVNGVRVFKQEVTNGTDGSSERSD